MEVETIRETTDTEFMGCVECEGDVTETIKFRFETTMIGYHLCVKCSRQLITLLIDHINAIQYDKQG